MNAEERAAIRQMLESHNTLTLATAAEGAPWAASLFYANDPDLHLYFVSDYRTRHARELAADGQAMATINADCGRWTDVRGLQLRGTVSVVDGAARLRALRYYLGKFADVKSLFEAPKSEDEQTIAERLKAANFYCLEPRWIRLIDNSKWFGYKLEVDL